MNQTRSYDILSNFS